MANGRAWEFDWCRVEMFRNSQNFDTREDNCLKVSVDPAWKCLHDEDASMEDKFPSISVILFDGELILLSATKLQGHQFLR